MRWGPVTVFLDDHVPLKPRVQKGYDQQVTCPKAYYRMNCLKQGDLWIQEEKDSTDQSPLSGRIFLYRLGSWHQNCGQALKIVKCLQAHCWIWPKHKPRQVMIIFTIWWHLRSGLEDLKAWCFEIPQAIDKFPRSQTMSDFRLPCMEKYGICGAHFCHSLKRLETLLGFGIWAGLDDFIVKVPG